MAPLSWLTLMIMFVMILMTFNILSYYSFSPTLEKSIKLSKKKSMTNWKW